jgi:hypothetical protein
VLVPEAPGTEQQPVAACAADEQHGLLGPPSAAAEQHEPSQQQAVVWAGKEKQKGFTWPLGQRQEK